MAALDELFVTSEVDRELDVRLLRALPPVRAAMWIGRDLERNYTLLDVVDYEPLLDNAVAALDHVETYRVALSIGEAGPRALGALERGLRDASAERASLIAIALGRIQSAGAVQLLVELLGHSRKAVREAAKRSLREHGELARSALLAASSARAKRVRTAASELLAQLTKSSATNPLEALEMQAASLDPSIRAAILDLPFNPHNHLREMAAEHGPVVAVVVRPWFLEKMNKGMPLTDYFGIATSRIGGPKNPDFDAATPERQQQAIDAAYVCLDALARLPGSFKGRARKAIIEHTERHFGTWAVPAAIAALDAHHPELAEPLLAIAAKDPERSKALLIQSLADGPKAVREICIDALRVLDDTIV